MPIPALATPRLLLRPFNMNDTLPLHNLLVEPGVLRYFPDPSPPPVEKVGNLISRQMNHWAKHGYGWWAVENPQDPRLMGWCGLQYLPETGEIEIGYLLGKPFWGKGYATEAGLESLRFGFKELSIEKIIAIVHPENTASKRVIEKLGFKDPAQARYFGMECLRYIADRTAFTANDQRLKFPFLV